MRDPQFLLNRRIILNHDISEATINAGWKRKVGAVANEDNLKKAGQGWDIVINPDFEMTDVEKILPSAVPPSDMELASQMADMIFSTSGVNLESWAGDDHKQMSGLTLMLKQGANLMVLQKYFDQWDYSLKLLGDKMLNIVLNNWNASKVGLILGEEPTPHFYSHIFAKYQVVVEEGLNTAVQKQQEFAQWVELNTILGGVIPPSEIAKRAVIQGKSDLVAILAQQEQMQQAQSAHAQNVAAVLEEAKVKELYSKAAANIAMARERHGRAESNIGLFEERLSEITRNRALATKDKMDALEKLVDVIQKYVEIETNLKMQEIDSFDYENEIKEDAEKVDAKRTAMANDFVTSLLGESGV
jgi:septum formation topological specificity factor MinE